MGSCHSSSPRKIQEKKEIQRQPSLLEIIVEHHNSRVQWIDSAIMGQMMIKDMSNSDGSHCFSDVDLSGDGTFEDYIYVYLSDKIPLDKELLLVFDNMTQDGESFEKIIDCRDLSRIDLINLLEDNKTVFQHKFSILFKSCLTNKSNVIRISYEPSERILITWANKVILTKKEIEIPEDIIDGLTPKSDSSLEINDNNNTITPSSSSSSSSEDSLCLFDVPVIIKSLKKGNFPPSILICSAEESGNKKFDISNWIKGSKIDICYLQQKNE